MAEEKESEKKKKLLIATDNFLPRWDGIARFLKEIIPELVKKYDVTVLSPNFGTTKDEKYKHIKIPLGKHKMGDYHAAKIDFKTIKKIVQKQDLIFTQTIGPIGLPTIIYAKKYKIPVAAFIHSIEWELAPMATKNKIFRKFLYPFMKFYTRYAYNKVNLIITPSEDTSEQVTWQGINTKKTVANLGVNSEVFKPLKERTQKEQDEIEELRKKLGLEDKFVIGNHGRLAQEKDLYTLIRAFNWLQKKYEDIALIIVGDGLKEIKDKIEKNKDAISIPKTNEVEKYLNLMDVYVTTSLTETTSLATLEAMSSGIPVISTPVGFIKEYIDTNQNGFLIPKKDNYSLFKTIDLLKTNKDLAKKIGEKGRKSIIKRFEWKNTADNIIKALDGLE